MTKRLHDDAMLGPEPVSVGAPAGIDRRAFMMRSAMIGAVAVLSGSAPASAKDTGAVKAWTGFMIASNEIPADRRFDFDTTVTAMALTARKMNAKGKETSEGGLAVSVVLC